MFNFINKFFIFLLALILIISIFFIPIIYPTEFQFSPEINDSLIISGNGFCWPLPGFTYISSYFGKRTSPTSGASTYHSGIDIPAPTGSSIYAVDSGYITFASWGAGGVYTLVLELDNSKTSISYCHLSPTYIVTRNQFVKKGEHIGFVGPKNVYGINNNPYRDENGNPTNGATTGPHLHLTIKEDGIAVDPLLYF